MFEYRITKNKSVLYCGKDLPAFLEERKLAGLLQITAKYTEAKDSAVDALSFVPETTEVPVSAPKKKATTKKSAK
jgi:hypothetical protein